MQDPASRLKVIAEQTDLPNVQNAKYQANYRISQ